MEESFRTKTGHSPLWSSDSKNLPSFIHISGRIFQKVTANDKHGVRVITRGRPQTGILWSSYKIRNCLNIHEFFDILDNSTSQGVASPVW